MVWANTMSEFMLVENQCDLYFIVQSLPIIFTHNNRFALY